jgi:hypothetical protein
VKWSKLNPMHLVASHSGEVRIWDLRVHFSHLTFSQCEFVFQDKNEKFL